MKEINQARRILYHVIDKGNSEEIIEASRKLDKLILCKMRQITNKKQGSYFYCNNRAAT